MHRRRPGPEKEPPELAARRRRAHGMLCTSLLLALSLPLARGWVRAHARGGPAPPSSVAIEIDLARDPAWRLALLPGIGPGRAREIVRARELFGPPPTLEALRRIPTIGPVTVARLRAARAVRVVLAGRPVGCGHEP